VKSVMYLTQHNRNRFFKKSLRLSPVPIKSGVLGNMRHAYRQLGHYEEAVATYKKLLQLYGPDDMVGHLGLAGTYALMGREKEARSEAAEVLRIDPKFSLERYTKIMPFKSQAMIDNVVEPLRKARLK
jgi:tetratricopeptide (TPR) repeat protein